MINDQKIEKPALKVGFTPMRLITNDSHFG